MKTLIAGLSIFCFITLTSCMDNSYDRNSTTDDVPVDSGNGYQTGDIGVEPIAAPNAANTKRTPVPMDTVKVEADTTNR
jgi:hypothetical protein